MRQSDGARSPKPPPPVVDISPVPVSGDPVPGLEPFDDAVIGLLRAEGIPGGALAVARRGRILLSRGYGVLENGMPSPVVPETRFRIASVAKPITAVAALALIEDRREEMLLDAPFVERLGVEPWLPSGRPPDPRLARITLRQVLRHTGGWDREKSSDPMFQHERAARELGVPPPPSARDMARWGLGLPLDFDPGARFAYSNFGYCLVGRWIEAVSGMPYETFVRQRVLDRFGMASFAMGGNGRAGRLPGETAYHLRSGDTWTERPYTEVLPAAFDSHGGWVGSAADLVRFADLWNDAGAGGLTRAMASRVDERPSVPLPKEPDGSAAKAWHGLGWLVRPVAGGANRWHAGHMAGSTSLLVRLANGTTWALLLNQRTASDVDRLLHDAARRCRW